MPHTDSRPIKSTSESKRRASVDTMKAVAGAVVRQHDALPEDSPRVRPTLPTLRFMQRDDGGR